MIASETEKTVDDLIGTARTILEITPRRWRDLTKSVPAWLLTRAPRAGEWSAVQCLEHMIDGERFVFPVRIRAILAREDIVDFDPDSQGKRPEIEPAKLARQFSRLRTKSLAVLDGVSPSDLSRTARHSALGTVTLEQLISEWAAHDLMHLVQAERALMQPFSPGTGPWRPYFADHDVDAFK